jgi:hypothetical protein
MEKFLDIIAAVKNQQPVNPPDAFTDQVMARLEKIDQSAISKIKCFFSHQQKISLDAAGIFFGRITSYQQCAFLLLMVGFFYLVTGFVTAWGFHDAIAGGNINPWLKMQPYITIGSALFILSSAFLIIYHPQATAFIQYSIIVHTLFILVNALILESILSFPIALIYVLILTMMAIGLSVLLIASIRSVLIFRMIHEGGNCA